MNKRQVIILWIIAVALAASVAFVKFGREKETKSVTNRTTGQTLLESFSANDVATIDIKGAESSFTLVKKDGKWLIPQRENFAAKTGGVGSVNELLRTVGELKVAQGLQAGPSFAPHFGMDENSKEPKEHGINVVFKDAAGKEVANITVGKNIESSAGSGVPMMGGGATGRFVRNHADASGFYAVSELFASLSDQPKTWLSDDFIRAEKIQSISVTQPGKSDIAWKVVRNNEDSEFAIEGAAAAETIDPATATSLKDLFSFARFDDIVPAADVEKRAIADQKRVATIITFEGITYTITFTPSKPSDKPASTNPEDPSPAADELYLVNVAVSGEIAKERKKEEGEKAEDAKAKDEAFAKRTKELNDKLAKEKALAPYTFQMLKGAFEHLVKDRAGLLKKPEAQTQNPQGSNPPLGGTFKIPSGGLPPGSPPLEAVTEPIEAVTPAVSAPPAEQKPAETKPAEPAPEKK